MSQGVMLQASVSLPTHWASQMVKEPLTTDCRRLALGLGSTLCLIVWGLRKLLCSQLGLFVELSPEDMLLGMEETEDDGDLEAELLALTGEAGTTGRKPAPKEQGEFAALGWARRWDQMGSGRWWRGSSPHSWEEPGRSPHLSDSHVSSAALPPRGRLALLTHLCEGALTPSLD